MRKVIDTEGVIVDAEQALGPQLLTIKGGVTRCASEGEWVLYSEGEIIGIVTNDEFIISFTFI